MTPLHLHRSLLALALVFGLASHAAAQHTCNASSAAQFQSCLDEASTGIGASQDSVITLAAGTYNISANGNMPFMYVIRPTCNSGAVARSLTITGAGAGSTILDGNDLHQVLHIRHERFGTQCCTTPLNGSLVDNNNDDSNATISVEGVTIRNGNLVAIPEHRELSGTSCRTSCDFRDFSESAGGLAVKVQRAGIDLRDSVLVDNVGHEGGGAKLHKACGSSGVSVVNNLFDGNRTVRRQSLDFWFNADCEVFLTDTGGLNAGSLSSQRPESGGGAKVSARDGLVRIDDNVFVNNQANGDQDTSIFGSDGGGLSGKGIFGLGEPGANNVPSCPNSDSPWAVSVPYDPAWGTNPANPPTILVGGSVWEIERNRFENNIVNGGDGGGAHLWGNMMLADNVFVGNEARVVPGAVFDDAADGGGLHIFTRDTFDSAILTRNLFQNNSAAGEGGGLQLRSPRHRVDVTASVFAGNSSDGHVRSSSERHVSQGGGGGAYLFTDDGTLNFVNNSVCNNTAAASFNADRPRPSGHGGGIVVYAQLSPEDPADPDQSNPQAVANIYNNIIWGNLADANLGLGDDIFIEDLHAGSNVNYYWSGGTITDTQGSEINLFNNNFADIAHLCEDDPACTADLSQGGNTSLDPQFVNLDECRFGESSPMVGLPGFPNAPGMPDFDFDGNPINPSAPFLGAIGTAGSFELPDFLPVPTLGYAGLLALIMLVLLVALVYRRRLSAG